MTLFLFTSFNSYALTDTYFCKPELETLPILQGGRIKPLSVHAKESLKHLLGKPKFEGLNLSQAFCLLSAKSFGLNTTLEFNIKFEHVDTIKFFNDSHSMNFEKLIDMQSDIRTEWMRQADNSSYKKDLQSIMSKIALYQDIKSGVNWTLPEVVNNQVEWINLASFLTQEKIETLSETNPDPFSALFNTARANYLSHSGDKYMTEYYFDKASLTGWAMLATIIALCALVLFKRFNLAIIFAAVTVLIQTVYIALRVYISGRAPITNMYETVLFSGYGALILAMIIGHFKKEKVFVYMGLTYNFCTLMMITFAGSMVSSTISPLVPVLRDNFWLSTHVTTIIMSYGALALSWILANTILIRNKFQSLSVKDEIYYNDVIYTSLKWGVSMLAAGVILGGVWADYSWGRFWGWDPKETWSLIVLCLYMAILHGRYTNWITSKRFTRYVAAAFMSVMMAWFGVNYILASGLHSYGFSEGGAIFLGSFFFIQILIILATLDKKEAVAQ